MPKLPSYNGKYIPLKVEFADNSGKVKPNSEFPEAERVRVEMTYATIDQKNNYLQVYSEVKKKQSDFTRIKTDMMYASALRKHVIEIANLTDEKGKPIKTGVDLVNCTHPFLNAFKEDLFYRICGIRFDEESEDGPGELSEGEK